MHNEMVLFLYIELNKMAVAYLYTDIGKLMCLGWLPRWH